MNEVNTILCWALIGLPALVGAVVAARAIRRHVLPDHPRCGQCSYDLTGNRSKRCPECGQDLKSPLALARNRPLAEQLMISCILVGLATYGLPVKNRVLTLKQDWGMALVPSTAMLLAFPWIDADTQTVVEERFSGHDHGNGWEWQYEWLIRRYGDLIRTADHARTLESINRLSELAPQHRAALVTLCRSITIDNPSRRWHVAQSLGSVYGGLTSVDEQEMAIGALIGAISSEVETWNLLVEVAALEQMGPTAVERGVETILPLIQHAEQPVRVIAFDAMATLGSEQFKHFSDEQLGRVLEDLGATASYVENGRTYFYGESGMRGLQPDPYLIEMTRRGGPALAERLSERLAMRIGVSKPDELWPDGTFGLYGHWRELGQLEVLTALRRIQNRTDPLTVVASPHLAEPGVLTIQLVNTDPDRQTILMQHGGDNRGPRMERFHIEVRDEQGVLLATQFETMNFGGISGMRELRAGESMSYTLTISDYARLPTDPGTYSLVVHYHNVIQIAAESDVTRFITSRSEPIPLTIP